jgi:hypothetical protein
LTMGGVAILPDLPKRCGMGPPPAIDRSIAGKGQM